MLGVSRPIYINVDSPNLGFPYFNFLGGKQWKKHPVCVNVTKTLHLWAKGPKDSLLEDLLKAGARSQLVRLPNPLYDFKVNWRILLEVRVTEC